MDAPYTIIAKILNAAKSNDTEALSEYFADHAMIVINGRQILSSDFTAGLINTPITWFSFDMLNVLCSDEEATQAVFELELQSAPENTPCYTDTYFVTTTWSNIDDECKVIYLMAAMRR